MAATMRDVAALAGVSLKTVSRVVNLEPHIRPEVVQRVRSAIAELGWVPNGSARTLRTGRTNVIAVGVPHLGRPYHAKLTEAVVAEISRGGMQAAVEPTRYDPERIRALLGAVGRSTDGLVLLGRLPAELAPEVAASRAVVMLQAGFVPGVDGVDLDLVEAATLLARHLEVMGRARPALVGFERFPDGERTAGEALTRVGLTVGAMLGRLATREEGSAAARELVASVAGLDAIVCASDELATGVLHELLGQGRRVPDEIAVTGFDDIDDSLFATPSITTIDTGPASMARRALDLLLDRLAGRSPDEARHVIAPVGLVRRESTLGLGVA